MNKHILLQDVQDFINDHLKSDLHKLILKGTPFNDISIQEIANQISCKKKSEKKLPSWYQNNAIYYPSKINIEQSSSEKTASYKSALVSGKSLIDLTGGFGVDSYYFSKVFDKVTYCEIDKKLSSITAHNFEQLQVRNVQVISENGIEYLMKSKDVFDVIYIDPSRRTSNQRKVFLLEDCQPNITENIDLLFSKTRSILLKTSPILDMTNAINGLKFVKEIHIVSINNEVKELLFLLEKEHRDDVQIKTINFTKESSQKFDFIYNQQSSSTYHEPQTYLYEPNAAILKSGGFHEISDQLKIFKLHQHSHLYTSEKLMDFPGRKFKIIQINPYDKKKITSLIPLKKANISTRNFRKTVFQIRKDLKIKDGGDHFLFFTTNIHHKPICIHCVKI